MAEYIEIPEGGIGEVSDGYHTFNSLYHQRLILTAALVKAHKDVAWKSWRHEDGQLCFGGGWFIVGFDTPDGGYTYHYEEKDWELFDCVELPVGKHWDGHTDEDVERLLSIPAADVAPRCPHFIRNIHDRGDDSLCEKWGCEIKEVQPVRHGRWNDDGSCSLCGHCDWDFADGLYFRYCPNCGAKMDGGGE